MAKFLGVISTRYQHPSDDLVLEFTDLDVLANFLYHETQNLLCDFQRKSEVITEQELNLCHNLIKMSEIYNYQCLINQTTLEMEEELEKIDFWLNKMEYSIDCLDTLPTNIFACKCTSNPQRTAILVNLIRLSEECMRIEEQMEQVQIEENCYFVQNPCDLIQNLLSFLDLHTKILENLDQKIDKVSDQLQEVNGLFINAHKRSIGACYHKIRHDVTSSFC